MDRQYRSMQIPLHNRDLRLPPPHPDYYRPLPSIQTNVDDCERHACPTRHSVNHHAPLPMPGQSSQRPQPMEPPPQSMEAPPQPMEPPVNNTVNDNYMPLTQGQFMPKGPTPNGSTPRNGSFDSLIWWPPSKPNSADSAAPRRLSRFLPEVQNGSSDNSTHRQPHNGSTAHAQTPFHQPGPLRNQEMERECDSEQAEAVNTLVAMQGSAPIRRNVPQPHSGNGGIQSPYLTPPDSSVGYGRINNHHVYPQMPPALPAEASSGTKRARETTPGPAVESSASKRVKICYSCPGVCTELENFRSTNSHYFGRNKTVTRKIPTAFMAWRCRKSYQRLKYKDDTKLGGSFQSQADSVRNTTDKIEGWWVRGICAERPLEWEIRMQAGIAKEGSVKSQDPINRELEKELAKSDLLGVRKTTKQVHQAVDVLLNKIPVLQKELSSQPVPDHLKKSASDEYKQWLKAPCLGKIEFLPQSLDEAWIKEGKRWDTETGRPQQ